ncbi:hypothetical protein ACT1UG_27600 [Bacillus paramycoides]|uniref:hypothetical protein n=1 Tax=Bacillus paramycoides TaxID=2026194 RepID=UPI0040584A10
MVYFRFAGGTPNKGENIIGGYGYRFRAGEDDSIKDMVKTGSKKAWSTVAGWFN